VARILVDTSAVYALLDRGDSWHEAAAGALRNLKAGRAEPLLTNFVVAECHALALSRLGPDVARRWLLGNVWPVERVTVEDEVRARTIIEQYADKTFSYTNATTFAVMERLGLRKAFAFDPHFQQYGFQVVGPS
jgi:predicted nucleic acid-binding protein